MMSFPQYHRYIEIAIKQCRSSGIDCKVHGLSIIGRIRAEDEDLATVPFLASDNEEEDDDKAATGRYCMHPVGGFFGKWYILGHFAYIQASSILMLI